jgi:hypothetical protein
MRFDPYTIGFGDEMLAEGGRPAAVRHDPTGHEDCAREWEPCECHGDRLCQLGKLVRWARTNREHLAWLRGEREESLAAVQEREDRLDGRYAWAMKVRAAERSELEFAREIWPLIVANGRQAVAEAQNRQLPLWTAGD